MADNTSSTPKLPNPRRIITDTDLDTGLSGLHTSFDESLPVVNEIGGALYRLGYVTVRPPQALNGGDLTAYGDYLRSIPPFVKPGGGAVVWYVDVPPGAGGPMHRTVSLDIVVVLHGEVELSVESGEKRLLKPGDLTIQRASTHTWRNLSPDKWARMFAVMSESQPVKLNDGTELGGFFPAVEG